MIVGDPNTIAIETGITEAYERLSLRALGFFVIYVRGRSYGVRQADATLLACSYDQVNSRLTKRGQHVAPFAKESDAESIAQAVYRARYDSNPPEQLLGIAISEFRSLLNSSGCVWAPDGDAAFDDGSYVLQFDVDERARVIAFKSNAERSVDRTTIRDVWIGSEEFYRLLFRWKEGFEATWADALARR